ncbi:MAG TPA: transglutaminase family protein [Allosphingosinicella sp.]
MRLTISHRTLYRFSRPLTDVVQMLRLTPLSCLNQTVLDWRIDVDCNARLREARDGYGNVVHALYVDEPVIALSITASGQVVTDDRAGIVSGLPGELPPAVFMRSTDLTASDDALRALAAEIAVGRPAPLDRLHALSAALHEGLAFDTESSDASTPAATAFKAGRGVCQDFAHIFIAVCRHLGIGARYISGHLFRRDGAHRQPAAHAWVEAWLDDLGWVAFDPTNGISTDDAYVRVACGLDYRDAAPVAGARSGGGTEALSVEVQVREARAQAQSQMQN